MIAVAAILTALAVFAAGSAHLARKPGPVAVAAILLAVAALAAVVGHLAGAI